MKKISRIIFIISIVVVISLGYTACLNDGADGYGDANDSSGSVGEVVPIPSGNATQEPDGNQDETQGQLKESEQPDENKKPTQEQPVEEEITKVYLTINSNKLQITLAKNSSVDALVERLKKGDITYTADDYGGFEKVGGLGFSLPNEDTRITAQAGDVILYSSNQIVLFYGSNTWSYTRLGRIEGYTSSQLQSLFGNGSVKVTLSIK